MSEEKPPGVPDVVELLVRNPSASFSKDLKLKISAGATIQALKEELREQYDGHPLPANQKLIISGQIVKETQLLKEVLKHANLSEPQVVHLVISGSKPDASKPDVPSSSTTPPREPTPPQAPRFASRPSATQGAATPVTQTRLSVANDPSVSTPPLRPPPPAPATREGTFSSSGNAANVETAARRTAVQNPTTPIGGLGPAGNPTPLGAQNAQLSGGGASTTHSAGNPASPGPQTFPQNGRGGPSDQQAGTSGSQNPSMASQGGGAASASGQSNGGGASDPMAGLSQEALQQLYLQLLQSNPFLTPLACNLAALSMGLPPPPTNPAVNPPLAALFPGFNFAAPPPWGVNLAGAPGGGQNNQAAGQAQPAPPAQGGPFAGLFQPPAAAGGQAGGLAGNNALLFPAAGPGQNAQIHFLHPGGALPPHGFPVDPAAQAGAQQRAGQNGAPPQAVPHMNPFGGIPPGQFGGIPQGQFGGIPQGIPVVVRVRRIQIDFMLIAKLAVIVFVLNQDGSIERLLLLTFLAALAYLYQTGVLAPYVRAATERFQRMLQQGRPAAVGANPGAPGNGPGNLPNPAVGGGLAAAVQRQRAGGGFLHEVQLFVMGFITSLLPGFQAPEGIPEPGQAPPPQGAPGGGAEDRPHRD